MKLIEPTTVLHSSVNDLSIYVPHAPVISDPTSFENHINLLNVIKKFDDKYWLRGEVFGSTIFLIYTIQFGYIAFLLMYADVDLYHVG